MPTNFCVIKRCVLFCVTFVLKVLRKDLQVDQVQLGLDFVTSNVVDREIVFIKDQMFSGGGESAETQETVKGGGGWGGGLQVNGVF